MTRMKPGYICIAGIDPETGKHIRPVLSRGRRLARDLLRKEGGVFEVGALVNLGVTKYVGQAPETEDYEFEIDNLCYVSRVQPNAFWDHLIKTSHGSLRSIFGCELLERQRSCTVDVHSGTASLGNLEPEAVEFFQDGWGKLRMRISDGQFRPNLSVTDIRLYKGDQKTIRSKSQMAVANLLRNSKIILAVGLTRPWAKHGDADQRHWLQINNIHLQSDPLGEVFEF